MISEVSRTNKVSIVEIDLSSEKVEKWNLGPDVREKYLGSRGINSRILYDNVGPETDAFSPDNVLIFGAGVFGGTGVPSGSRMSITSKSPYCVFGYSNSGGHFASELRKAGYDHIIVRGKAEKPVFLWIDNDKVEFRSAAHLWGKNTEETDHLIKKELGNSNIKVAAIGQAGENLVKIANIMITLNRGAGGKFGAVMGSKNLKAIAIKGSGEIELANKKLVRELSRNLVKRIKEQPLFDLQRRYSSAMAITMMYEKGTLPIKNLTTTVFEEIGNINEEALEKYFTGRKHGCPGCPVTNQHPWEIKEGPYAGEKGLGIEGGPAILLGPNLGNSYAPGLLKSVKLLDDYGIDAIEASGVIGAAMEWFEKGVVTKEDLDGIELKWGDHAAIIELIHKIGRREGIGDLLAEGTVRAAERIGKGAKDYINYAKGRVTFDDSRVMRGLYLNGVTSSPACDLADGWPCATEHVGDLGDPDMLPHEFKAMALERYGTLDAFNPLSYNKAGSVVFWQDFCMVMDSVDLCEFVSEYLFGAITLKDISELFQAVTGIDMREEDLKKAAVRIRDLERAFWVREGFTRKNDRLEGKLVNQAVPDGPFKGERLDQAKCEKMLDEYYQLRGWDIKTGIPTKEKLLKDDLADVVEDLEMRGKLGSGVNNGH